MKWQHIARDEQGATAVEFALVAGIFFVLFLGIIEIGLFTLTKVAIESVAQHASRATGIGDLAPGCSDRVCAIRSLVHTKTLGLIHSESVIVTSTTVSSPVSETPPIPDVCFDDPADPYPETCLGAFADNSGGPLYDPPGSPILGIGEDMVEIRITYLWRVLFPIMRSRIGEDGVVTITASTVVKNEPF